MKSLSLMQKLTLSAVPMIIGVAIVSFSIYSMNATKDSDGERALQMMNYVVNAELEMVKMSESLRGYLLNPSDKNEFAKKKEADAMYSEYSGKLGELVTDAPEIMELNKKMAEYDETDLDRIEDEVGELIAKGSPDAVKYYQEVYVVARVSQNKNFADLKKMVSAKSKQILDDMQARKVRNAWLAILGLIGTTIIGFGISQWVTTSAIKHIVRITKDLSTSALVVDGSSQDIAGTSQALSQSTSEQAASLEQTTASLEEIRSMVAKATDNARSTADKSNDSKQKAEAGKEVVNQMMNTMTEINQSNEAIMNQVDSSNKQMSEIVKVIQEIGNKTKVINDIVFQTKLLSFNASVEAARAGEHGKGFAVVAEEVGKLAQMSGNAAKEISDMLTGSIAKVEGIVDDTKKKVEVLIADGKAKVESGVDVAKQCADVLNEIVENVALVSTLAQEISTASQEQSQGISEINKAMIQLDQVTQDNAGSSEKTASSAGELSTQAGVLKNAVRDLITAVQGSDATVLRDSPPPRSSSSVKPVDFGKRVVAFKAASGDTIPDKEHKGFRDV